MVKIGNIEVGDFPVALSPMEDITDPPFRRICKEYGADLLMTEFIASDALVRDVEKSLKKMIFSDKERPVGVQIFGNDAETMSRAAQIAQSTEPDFIDINWGCPVKKIAGKGCGSGILADIPKMISITKQIVDSVYLPVTVKTRIGYEERNKPIVEVAERLQDIGIKAISIHGRTKVQMYKGVADWTLIGEVKSNPRMQIPVFGNGDINSPEKALEMKERYGVDGILIGRATIGNPWIFKQIKDFFNASHYSNVPLDEKINICLRHLEESIEWKGEKRGVFEMRKHYSNYFKGISDFKPLRIQLLSANTLLEVYEVFEKIKRMNFNDQLFAKVE